MLNDERPTSSFRRSPNRIFQIPNYTNFNFRLLLACYRREKEESIPEKIGQLNVMCFRSCYIDDGSLYAVVQTKAQKQPHMFHVIISHQSNRHFVKVRERESKKAKKNSARIRIGRLLYK